MATAPVLLELDLTHGVLEAPPSDPLTAWRARHLPVLPVLIEKLRRAQGDEHVRGLVAHLGGNALSPSQVQELGAAIEALGAAGKPTLAWTETFGEGGGGTLPYHLASFFDEVWLQPSGGVDLTGAAAAPLFVRSALDRLGVQPQIHARHEYKNAPDMFLRDALGEAQREATQELLDGILGHVVSTLERRRDVTAEAARDAIAAAPLTAAEALERGLVDRLDYRAAAYERARRLATGTADDAAPPQLTLTYVQHWSPPLPARVKRQAPRVAARAQAKLRKQPRKDVIALVPVHGAITLGSSGSSPLGNPHAGSGTVTAALRQAGKQDEVAAVVVRIDSPGGSYVASDAIHHEVLALREQGIPVVASMGSVAASGGYFAAMGADEILALPGTITGSIGVFAGKFVVREALQRVGVNQELITTGHQAAMWSAARSFSDEELGFLDRWLDEVYDDFTHKAAEGRGMPHEQLEPLARGRVWTGSDAVERGLIDALGGLDTAIDSAASRAGIDRDDATVRRFPHASPVARLRTPKNSESPAAAVTRGSLLAGALTAAAGLPLASAGQSGAAERLLEQLGAQLGLGPSGALQLPPLRLG